MLMAWKNFVEEVDPDMLIGYNISNFDLPYLLDRAKALKVNEFPYLGRLQSECIGAIEVVPDWNWKGSLIEICAFALQR